MEMVFMGTTGEEIRAGSDFRLMKSHWSSECSFTQVRKNLILKIASIGMMVSVVWADTDTFFHRNILYKYLITHLMEEGMSFLGDCESQMLRDKGPTIASEPCVLHSVFIS